MGREAAHYRIRNLLSSGEFAKNQDSFITKLFDYYIRPLHKNYPSEPSTPQNQSRKNSVDNLNPLTDEKELAHFGLTQIQIGCRTKICSRNNSVDNLNPSRDEKEPTHSGLAQILIKRERMFVLLGQPVSSGSSYYSAKNHCLRFQHSNSFRTSWA